MEADSAKRLVFPRTGSPSEVLEVSGFRKIPPKEGEILVRISAAPLNPADLNFIEGTYGVKPELPAIPGIEGCGIVETSASPDFRTGDRVLFLRRASTWATHATVPADTAFKLPDGIDPLQAALLKVNPATAWRLLHGFADLKPGDWIVQNAGNSAVGRCVIQLARALGLRTVSFLRKPDLFEELRQLGGDHVAPDDETGFASAREILGGARAAAAFNAVGGESALRLMKLLRDGAPHVTYGAMGRKPLTIPNGLLIFKDIRIHGLWVTRWIENAPPGEIRAVYHDLANRVLAGTLVQKIDSTFPLEDFRSALARLNEPGRSGKVLFTP